MSKILLIDDDPTMLSLLTTLLEIEGFTTAQWKGEPDILQLVKDAAPDVILLDVNLKTASGFDVITAVRADTGLAHTSVIMSSGMDYREKCLALGANDFLLKPYMPDDLINLIRSQETAN
jgi:CheY-like chemotaxis protein